MEAFVIFCLGFITAVAGTKYACPEHLSTDNQASVFKNKCYRFNINKIRDYDDAKKACKDDGAILASVKSEEVNSFLREQLLSLYGDGPSEKVWIGLSDKEKETDFIWEDGTKLEYQNFASETGTFWGNFMDCVLMDPTTGKWTDTYCIKYLFGMNFHPFICEYPASEIVPTTKTPVTHVRSTCSSINCDIDCGMLGYRQDPITGCVMCECDD